MRASKRGPSYDWDHMLGDGLCIKLGDNKGKLWIEGDGCRVILVTNTGKLRVSGDGCRVQIQCNLGSVEYWGDGGHVVLGPDSVDRRLVKYRGDGGLVEFHGKPEQLRRDEKGDAKTTSSRKTETEPPSGRIHTTRLGPTLAGLSVNVGPDNRVVVNFS